MPEKYSKFRNGANERLTQGLFIETRPTTQKAPPIYTLRDWDHTRPNGDFLPSLYLLYMSEADPTEYQFATKHLDGWEHWQLLCECEWFKPYVSRWREELELRIKSDALKQLQEVAKDPSHKHYSDVNKFLVNGGWKPKSPKGRPSKAQVAKEAREIAMTKKDLTNDFERVMIALNEPISRTDNDPVN